MAGGTVLMFSHQGDYFHGLYEAKVSSCNSLCHLHSCYDLIRHAHKIRDTFGEKEKGLLNGSTFLLSIIQERCL